MIKILWYILKKLNPTELYVNEQAKTDALQKAQEKITSIDGKINGVKQRIIESNIDVLRFLKYSLTFLWVYMHFWLSRPRQIMSYALNLSNDTD